MEQLDQISAVLALTMGAAWASGLNLYAAIFMLGMMGVTGNVDLPPGLEVLQNPLVLFAAGTMYVVEFFADKIQVLIPLGMCCIPLYEFQQVQCWQ